MSGHRSRPTEVAATLDAGCKNGPMRNQVATAVLSAFRMARFDRYEADETASTLMARNFKAATDLVAFSCKDCGADAHKELSPTLRAMNHSASHANAGGQVAIAFNQGNLCRGHGPRPSDKVFQTLRTHAGDNRACVATRLAVRRLTPRECERLQGMPDDWTLVPYRGKPAADAPRYKAVGNSMAVCVMRWIGRRLLAVDQRKF